MMARTRETEEDRRQQILEAAYRVAASDRLDGLSTRKVAVEAGVSNGLVFFHFENREMLLLALLDWMLDKTAVLTVTLPVGADAGSPLSRLTSVVASEARRLARDRRRVELFFDFWVTGTRNAAIRRRMRAALREYREAFLRLAGELGAGADNGLTPTALASLVVSIIHGCAVQAVIDADAFRVGATADAAKVLLGKGLSAIMESQA